MILSKRLLYLLIISFSGEKLALRLRELEQEKSRLEWERHEEVARRRAEETARNEHENRIQAREQELRKQEVYKYKFLTSAI